MTNTVGLPDKKGQYYKEDNKANKVATKCIYSTDITLN